MAGGASLGLVGGLLAACGGSSKSTSASTSASTAASGSSTATATTSSGATSASPAATSASPAAASTTTAAAATSGASGGSLVVGSGLAFKSLDPARLFEVDSNMIGHAIYDALVTFEGEDLKTPKPLLGSKWEISTDGLTYTFTLQDGVKFTSGNPLTSTDVQFSLNRVKNVKGNPAFLVDPISDIAATDPKVAVITLSAVSPSILPILSSPSVAIVDSKTVQANGGDASAQAKDNDKAEPYLNGTSAGTGPYMLQKYTPNTEIDLVKNPNYWGGAVMLDRIVLRAITDPAAQKLQIEKGDLDIALNLTQDQIATMKTNKDVTVKTSVVASTFYILMNNNPPVGGIFSNPKVQQAVRYALDYDGIMTIAGQGAQRLAGVIPTVFAGAWDPSNAPKMDQAKAKSLLQEANAGELKGALSYASDLTGYGVQFSLLAQKIQSDLSAVGITLTLDGLPTATSLQKYRDAKDQIGIWSWTADYADASDYLVYCPGQTVGKRAGWAVDASPEAQALDALSKQASTEVDDAKRIALYQQIDQKLVETGPYAPLFLPAQPYAYRKNIQGVVNNSVWAIDLKVISKS
jgi:peptide/nickel transport system substrate-binding protein